MGLDIDYYEIFKNLGKNIENTSVYKTKLEDVINNMKGVQFSEKYFRTIVDASVMYSSMNKELYKHNLMVELPNEYGKRLDSFLYGLGNASFVIEYKVLKSSMKLKDLIEDAQWQLYINNYLNAGLQSYKETNNSTKLVARVMILEENESLNKKIVHIIDHKYTIEQARRVSKLFYQEKNGTKVLLENNEDYLIGAKKLETRSNYLREKGANSLEELLEREKNVIDIINH